MLAALTPVRLTFILRLLQEHSHKDTHPLSSEGLRVLDWGCGEGLLALPLAKKGCRVTGVDPDPVSIQRAIEIRENTWTKVPLSLEYEVGCWPSLPPAQGYDVILACDTLEHNSHVHGNLSLLASLLHLRGVLCISTINRTLKAGIGAIFLAEHVLGWIDKGTHRFQNFITPQELLLLTKKCGLVPLSIQTMQFHLWKGFLLEKYTPYAINYIAGFAKTPGIALHHP